MAKDAVEVIDNYKKVVDDLDTAVSTISLAKQLIAEVRENITGDGLSRLEEACAAAVASSNALRQQMMELDYRPQGY